MPVLANISVMQMGVYDMYVLLGCVGLAVSLTCVPLILRGRHWRIKFAARYEYFKGKQY